MSSDRPLLHTAGGRVSARHLKYAQASVPIAQAWAERSKDPSTKVGAVFVSPDGDVQSQGFNGFPRGVEDSEERLNDRPTKYRLVCHAEANGVAQAARAGRSLASTIAVVTPLPPCHECAKLLINAGVVGVLAPPAGTNERWSESAQLADDMFAEAGVARFHTEV